MAFYFGQEDENVLANAPQASKQSSVISSGQIAPETAAANTASANNARTNPGNFVGISQYLDANKPQAANLANQVGGVITGASDAARSELQNKASETEQGIKSNTVGYDQAAVDQLNKDASKADVNKLQGLKTANYQGPTSLGNIDSLGRAQQAAANADTEEGRRALVGDLYKDQPLKKGALTFDNLLLQASPESKGTLSEAQKKANVGGLEKDIAAEKARLESAAGQAKETTAKTAADTRKAIADAQKGFETGLQGRVDQTRAQAAADSQAALDRLRAGKPGAGLAAAKDLELLGINQDQYDKLLKAGSSGQTGNILDPSGINAANVASADDYARYNVLKRLAEGGNFLGDDASQAGKYNSDLLDFVYNEPAPSVASVGNTFNPIAVPGSDIGIPRGDSIWNGQTLNTDFVNDSGSGTDPLGRNLQAPSTPAPLPPFVSDGQGVWNGQGLNTDLQGNNYNNFPLLSGFTFY